LISTRCCSKPDGRLSGLADRAGRDHFANTSSQIDQQRKGRISRGEFGWRLVVTKDVRMPDAGYSTTRVTSRGRINC
jgi:hypothetical protein